ncbi:vitamin B12 transporter [Pseudoalteromonas carrageenovora]|uniref:Outer membrane vitamin B12 receptor BtuB n=1 Tax=Pseudoalteromonas carrageenovora IAM 12662 TaxID=1314868 RepID=A0A2K4XBR4_PSEVC|nr:TonB-dependent receptor [Pseudoalteromonas carrageenovora]MBE0383576.1 vitamin B12 transporter [Pseudoalteromonas carrageenovora IAM 12662]QBJ72647.1 vitamin B12 transporter [Pseudoalteromonas carrageenovora]GEB71051.1 vitamin B12 transporter BtuB [Pseudoalteromonas carrageenovora]SOU41768.1 Outer membrane vitamin B12 receptor BtuB [Pseudoalteromonas carrageenovora IAM 12662]
MLNKTTLGVAITAALSFSVSATDNSIEKITVTANKFEQSINDVLASVNVIDRAEIDASNVRDLPTLLSKQVGFQINPNGGFGQNSGVSLRGTGSGDTLILIDGVRTGSATLGQKALSNVPLNSIERIEIIKGSRAAVYGSDALAGVINIITREADNLSLDATFGSDAYQNYQVAGSVKSAEVTTAFNAGYEKTDGFDALQGVAPDEDGYENKNLGFKVNYSDAHYGDFKLLGQYNEGYADYDSRFSPATSTVEVNDFKNYQLSALWNKNYTNQSHSIDVAISTDDSDNTYVNFSTGLPITSTFITKRTQIDYNGQYTVSSDVNISGGVNWYNDDVSHSSEVFVEDNRDVLAVFVGAYYDTDTVLANLTFRQDDDEQFGDETTYTAAAGYHLSKDSTFRISQSTGFKAPTFNDLYYPNFGNPDLQPEKSLNRELGVNVNFDAAQVDVAIFRNDIEDKIDYDANFALANINEARYEGVEFSLSQQFYGFDSNINFAYLSAENKETGAELRNVAKRTFNWEVAKQFGAFDATLDMQYRSDREGAVTRLGSYTLWNLAGNYQVNEHIEVSLRVENLFDKEYNAVDSNADFTTGEVYYYNTPERRFFAGASYQF